jgi:hypothetical protein
VQDFDSIVSYFLLRISCKGHSKARAKKLSRSLSSETERERESKHVGYVIWRLRGGRREREKEREKSCNKNLPFHVPTWECRRACVGYLRKCNVLRRKMTHNKRRRRSDKHKWTGKVRERGRLWRHVSCPSRRHQQFILPRECAFTKARRKRGGGGRKSE